MELPQVYDIRAKMLYALQHQPLYFMRSLAKSCQNDVLLEKAHSPAAGCILDFYIVVLVVVLIKTFTFTAL